MGEKKQHKKDWPPVSVRIQPNLMEWIKEDANRESRTIAQELDYLIRRGIMVRQLDLEILAGHTMQTDNDALPESQKGDTTRAV